MKQIILLIITALCLTGCGELDQALEKQAVENKSAVQLCQDKGGIPTTSTWDGRLTNCIFPPDKK